MNGDFFKAGVVVGGLESIEIIGEKTSLNFACFLSTPTYDAKAKTATRKITPFSKEFV